MWVVQVALRRPYTFIVLALLIAIFGALAALRTPVDIFPNINIPVVSVVWTYTGLSPSDMSGRVIYYYERTLTAQVVMPGTEPTSWPMPSPRSRQTMGSLGNFQFPAASTDTRVPSVGGLSFS